LKILGKFRNMRDMKWGHFRMQNTKNADEIRVWDGWGLEFESRLTE